MEDIRSEKASKFKEFDKLKIKGESKEYDMWFLKYNPTKSKSKLKRTTKKNPSLIKNVKSKTLKNRLMNIFSTD